MWENFSRYTCYTCRTCYTFYTYYTSLIGETSKLSADSEATVRGENYILLDPREIKINKREGAKTRE